MIRDSTTTLYYMGLNETMFFQINKTYGYGLDAHGNRWRMIDGELEYYTGNRYLKDNALQWRPVRYGK